MSDLSTGKARCPGPWVPSQGASGASPNKGRCPRCQKRGRDRSGDNLAIYPDHVHCFSCGYHRVTDPLSRLRKTSQSLTTVINHASKTDSSNNSLSYKQGPPDFSAENFTMVLPSPARLWLDRYGITKEEERKAHLVYDLERDWLIYPIRDGERVVGISARNFGPGQKSYSFKYTKDQHYAMVVPPNSQQPSDIYVLVEDWVSGLKVGRRANAIHLQGSHISQSLLLSLVHLRPRLRIWLDYDKATYAIRRAEGARQLIPDCATIITELDPKEYSDEEIRSYIESTLRTDKGISQ